MNVIRIFQDLRICWRFVALLFAATPAFLHAAPSPAVYHFVVDLSGSMNRYVGGATLRDSTVTALQKIVEALPPNAQYGLRVFGHRYDVSDKSRGCSDTELLMPVGMHHDEELNAKLKPLVARGYTPLATSLASVEEDLKSAPAGVLRNVILLSDGADSCDGSPAQVLEQLRAKGIDFVVYAFGVGLDQPAREQLSQIAAATAGSFVEVDRPAELAAHVFAALQSSHVGDFRSSGATIVAPKLIPTAVTPLALPGDANEFRDAGPDAAGAIELRRGERYTGEVGDFVKLSQVARDDADTFFVRVKAGEKYRVRVEALRGGPVGVVVSGDTGALTHKLAEFTSEERQSDPILIEGSAIKLLIAIRVLHSGGSKPPIRRQYQVLVDPFVELE